MAAVTVELELPAQDVQEALTRADITYYGIDHSGPSFEVRVFADNVTANAETPLTGEAGFIGAFAVFGHGGCFGGEGHCEVRPAVTVFDRRPPHPLVPTSRTLLVTDIVRRKLAAGAASIRVTAVPVVRPSPLATADAASDVFEVDQVALHTYE